ncbi:MAG: penicillin-binding protein 2 [Candidatus Liptonbacteria bacterium]|nr:penicillin-binding protein 2 [Candidatus Liptonbacteria bacterium]
MGHRFLLVLAVLLLAYLSLFLKLYDLQLQNGEYYLAKAESRYLNPELLLANRGTIYFTDKNGNSVLAALNKNFPIIYAIPMAIDDSSEAANLLSPILGQPVESLLAKFSKKDDTYEPLVKKADLLVAEKVNDLKIKGVYVEALPHRFYSFGNLASQVLGFVGPSSETLHEEGRYGLEAFYENILAGKPGSLDNNKIVPPATGEDLRLTIDLNIQTEAERILSNLVKNYKATGGTVIVEEPRTGKILAFGNLPNFDPNNYSEFELGRFLNPGVQSIYEPGSVLKVITMAAGIDSGKITPDTTYVDTGSLTFGDREIRNYDLKVYGRSSMTEVIEHSINTGAAFAEKQTGHLVFKNYLEKFGFGEKTGIDLPGEVRGDLRRLYPNAPPIVFATASFGQGVAVTPTELINAISSIANKGKLMRPYLNANLEPQVLRTVIRGETAREVAQMMVSAIDKNEIAKISGYSIAGKTGTAQVPDFKNGGYTDRVVNTYVGFGPATNPRFVILIKLDEPAHAPAAAITVVPAFRDLAQFILNYLNIPPDRLTTSN